MAKGSAKSGPGKPGLAGGPPGKQSGFRSPIGCTGVTPGEAEFVAWCQEEKVRFPSSHLAVLPATGRALVASRNIKMGEREGAYSGVACLCGLLLGQRNVRARS